MDNVKGKKGKACTYYVHIFVLLPIREDQDGGFFFSPREGSQQPFSIVQC